MCRHDLEKLSLYRGEGVGVHMFVVYYRYVLMSDSL
jgi:hypothetical protein